MTQFIPEFLFCFLIISKLCVQVESVSVLVSELARTVAHEQALLDQSKDILSTVAVMHVSTVIYVCTCIYESILILNISSYGYKPSLQVKQCSLQGQVLQLNHSANTVQL